MLAAYKCFASGVSLLVYAVATFALSKPSDLSPIAVRGVPPPPGFNVTSLSLAGTGCPPGSVYYTLNVDGTALTITFNKYSVQVGPGIPTNNNRKNCALVFDFYVPHGFVYGIASVDYHSYYQLDVNVTARQTFIYYFQGGLVSATARSDLVGPLGGRDYTYHADFDYASSVVSPCNFATPFYLSGDLRVNNSMNTQGNGYIAVDSFNEVFNATLNFQWQMCR